MPKLSPRHIRELLRRSGDNSSFHLPSMRRPNRDAYLNAVQAAENKVDGYREEKEASDIADAVLIKVAQGMELPPGITTEQWEEIQRELLSSGYQGYDSGPEEPQYAAPMGLPPKNLNEPMVYPRDTPQVPEPQREQQQPVQQGTQPTAYAPEELPDTLPMADTEGEPALDALEIFKRGRAIKRML